jgi:hypothetical protein
MASLVYHFAVVASFISNLPFTEKGNREIVFLDGGAKDPFDVAAWGNNNQGKKKQPKKGPPIGAILGLFGFLGVLFGVLYLITGKI